MEDEPGANRAAASRAALTVKPRVRFRQAASNSALRSDTNPYGAKFGFSISRLTARLVGGLPAILSFFTAQS